MKFHFQLWLLLATTLVFSQDIDYSPKEIVISFKPTVTHEDKLELLKKDAQLSQLNHSFELDTLQWIGNKKERRTLLLRFKNNINVMEAVTSYFNTGWFTYVEPNFTGSGHGMMQTTPNDALFSSRQWSHRNNGTFTLSPATVDADIDTDLAWDITQGNPNLIVAILDSGVKLDHPEFAGRMVAGYDFAYDDDNPSDDHGHGTNVAGIALAKGNNSFGYAGVNWNSKIMPCKILDASNFGYYTWWADAIYFAVDNGAKVINMSVGGNSPSILLEDAINYAYNNNVSVTVSSGNQNGAIQYPARYANAFAIGSTNPNDTRTSPFFWSTTSGSNYGEALDFVAPGNFIYGLSHNSNTNYESYWGGTSQAAPHVAGVISLMLSVNPNLTVDQIRQVLQQTSEDQVGNGTDTAGWDMFHGYGRINAYAALSHQLLSNTEYFQEAINLKLYPNPVKNTNTLTVKGLKHNNYSITLHSMDGKLIENYVVSPLNEAIEISTTTLPSGSYILKIVNKNTQKMYSKKWIKQ